MINALIEGNRRQFYIRLFSALLLPVLVTGLWFYDNHKPVVIGFKIDAEVVTPSGVWISGWMDKRRDCEFEDMLAVRDDGVVVPLSFGKDGAPLRKFTRPLGVQRYGPLFVEAPAGHRVRLVARHTCFPVWYRFGDLLQFEVGAIAAKPAQP